MRISDWSSDVCSSDLQWGGASPVNLAPYRAHRRILTASLVGTAVEFYDFYIYGTAAALVFGPLFFPESSDSAQLMYSFMTFGLAFFARPVGAIVFGQYGEDWQGGGSGKGVSVRDDFGGC